MPLSAIRFEFRAGRAELSGHKGYADTGSVDPGGLCFFTKKRSTGMVHCISLREVVRARCRAGAKHFGRCYAILRMPEIKRSLNDFHNNGGGGGPEPRDYHSTVAESAGNALETTVLPSKTLIFA